MVTYLVTCATGQQGRAVVKYLLAAGAKVHVVVRDPLKETARQLESNGVVLFKGDNDAFDVFHNAAKGCKGLYLNLQPSITDPSAQSRQARGIVQACKEAGVNTIVLSTAFFASSKSKWDNVEGEKDGVCGYFASKAEMENAVRDVGVKHYTILRPAWFHANYLMPYSPWHFPELSSKGELVHSYDTGVKMSHIDEDDIGKYASAALLDPEKFDKQDIELASENLTIEQVAVILRKVSGREIKVRKRTPEEIEAAKNVVPTQPFQLWANRIDVQIDGGAIQSKYGIRLTTFEEYLEREKERLLASLPA
ncbi:NmrA family protein [Xylogone sp. PMI_703]|nr:NmrA family protein [Xylogone sp. PMI_703]